MIRTLSILAALPCLAGCGLEEIFNPGSSREAFEARAVITAPVRAISNPDPITVTPIPGPEDLAQEPVYYVPPPEPSAPYFPPPPTCQPIYMIVACGANGETILL